jgi:hypothetical protein
MSNLENRIRSTYGNADELIVLVRKVDLENVINKSIEEIERALKIQDSTKLIAISGTILNNVNSRIVELKDPEEKQNIEYLLADIFQYYLGQVATQSNGPQIVKGIHDNLKITCEISGYNFEEFSAVLNIKKHQVLIPQTNKNLHYEWLGDEDELERLIQAIHDRGYFRSLKEFKKLFKPIIGNLVIVCNKDAKNELLLFFHLLKEDKLIRPKGKGSSGHFAPFVQYAVDNDSNFLFEKDINKKHELLKRNPVKYQKLTMKIRGVIGNCIRKEDGQAVDNGHCPPKKPKQLI